METKILSILVANRGEFVSGEELSRHLKVSRTAVWKHINRLRGQGHSIDSVPSRGYRLTELADILSRSAILCRLDTEWLGRENIVHLPQTSSTNTEARKLADEGAAEGGLVIADTQTEGKGRLNRSWSSPQGGLWFSVILRPDIIPHTAPKLTFVAALAVARTIIETLDLPARIKWPNDILIAGKKVCGILTEMNAEVDTVNYAICGIGINVNNQPPRHIKQQATSLSREAKRELDRATLLVGILDKLEKKYTEFLKYHHRQNPASEDSENCPIVSAVKKLSCTLGNKVTVETPRRTFVGKALDIEADGALIIESKGTCTRILTGDLYSENS